MPYRLLTLLDKLDNLPNISNAKLIISLKVSPEEVMKYEIQ